MSSDKVQMAVVHRPCSSGVDLPPGASAADLDSTDYHVVEMGDVGIEMAKIHRPSDVVVDFPAGATVDGAPHSYPVVEIGDLE
jgi:hypothetical protein